MENEMFARIGMITYRILFDYISSPLLKMYLVL